MSSNNPTLNIDEIDEVIHGRLRLGIMAYLSAVNPASFPELLEKTATSNGNLSTHLTKLESAGYISQQKGYLGKKPQTLVHLTVSGRKGLDNLFRGYERLTWRMIDSYIDTTVSLRCQIKLMLEMINNVIRLIKPSNTAIRTFRAQAWNLMPAALTH